MFFCGGLPYRLHIEIPWNTPDRIKEFRIPAMGGCAPADGPAFDYSFTSPYKNLITDRSNA